MSARRLVSLAAVLIALLPGSVRAEGTKPILREVGRDLPTLPPKSLRVPEPPSSWLVESNGWLKVVYHPSLDHESVTRILRDADRVRDRLAKLLGQKVLDVLEVRIARTTEEMTSVAPIDAPPPPHANGVAYSPLHLVVLSRKPSDAFDATSIDEAFRHQLAHVALFDATAGRSLPRWLNEGFAVRTSGENGFKRIQTLSIAQVKGRSLTLAQLDSFPDDAHLPPLAYAESADFVRYLSRDGDRFVGLIARIRAGDPFERAVLSAYSSDLRTLEQEWRVEVSRRHLILPLTVGATLGWVLFASGIVIAWRRRKRRREDLFRKFREEAHAEAMQAAAARADAEHGEHARLLVVERGVGHVVYIVEQKAVPKVEHDGEVHTLH